MKYTPHTHDEINEMLNLIGVDSINSLFAPIPKELKTKTLNIPDGLSEMEVVEKLKKMSAKNNINCINFLGGGVYDHFIPAAADALCSRTEFYTAYTPYQPEASQGTLQALYEFQTMMCDLTGMDASNASMYDGATALAEAALMALRISKKRNRIVMDASVNPISKKVVETYVKYLDVDIVNISFNDEESIENYLDGKTAGFLFQNPAFDGTVEDFTKIVEKIHTDKAVAIVSVYPISLGMLKTPAEMEFDIAVGDGQSLGNPLSFGGPYFGFMTTTKKYVRNLPGRIVGKTVDKDEKEGYVLTLQAREQHIRRQKATSNICSNQSLCALNGLVYLSLLGLEGLKDVAKLCFDKTEYTKSVLSSIDGVTILNSANTFNEFVMKLPISAKDITKLLIEEGIMGGIPFENFVAGAENELLVAVTEKRSKEDIDTFAEKLRKVLS